MGWKTSLAVISSLLISSPVLADEPKRELHMERGIIRVQIKKDSLEEKIEETPNNPLNLKSRYNYNQKDLNKYQSWVKQCINHSQNNNFCLIVDKAAHEMDVYQNKKKVVTYSIELGRNPYDDKRMLGDKCTPEGIYRIRRVVKNSVFYKALYINYPNNKDRKEFGQWKKQGKIPKRAGIGGSIEIHGSGAEKKEDKWDWTLGCIALSNNNLDDLYQILGLQNYKTMKQRELRNITKKIRTCIVKYGTKDSYSELRSLYDTSTRNSLY